MKKEAPVRTELIFETEERDGQLVLTGYHGHKKTVVLPEDVTVVGMHAFRRCFSMEELIKAIKVYTSRDRRFGKVK